MSRSELNALNTALKDGVLERKLTRKESQGMPNSVVTVNKIVQAIGAEAIDLKQIDQQTKLGLTKLKRFLKWLESKRLINVQKNGAVHLYSRA